MIRVLKRCNQSILIFRHLAEVINIAEDSFRRIAVGVGRQVEFLIFLKDAHHNFVIRNSHIHIIPAAFHDFLKRLKHRQHFFLEVRELHTHILEFVDVLQIVLFVVVAISVHVALDHRLRRQLGQSAQVRLDIT